MRKIILFVFLTVFVCKGLLAQPGYVVNGSASYLGSDHWRLTPNQGSQGGSVWYQNFMSLNYNFDFSFQVYLGNNDAGADGIAFVLQPNSTGAGSQGGGLGYQGISPSLAVEYDTYQNDDPWYDHIALQPNGNVSTNGASLQTAPARADQGNIEDGQWHTTRIVWTASMQNLQVYFDGVLRINHTYNIIANIFGGNPNVYWGFTGATGGASNLQEFKLISSSFQVAPLTVTATGTMNCSNGLGSISATGSGGYAPLTYSLNGGAFQASSSFANVSAGSHTVTVKDIQGTQHSTTVTLTAPPSVTITAGGPVSFCAGGSVVLNANSSAGVTYQWRLNGNVIGGATNSSFTANSSGNYSVAVTNGINNCSAVSNVITVTANPFPSATATNNGPLNQGETLILNAGGGSTYQWSGPNGFSSTLQNPVINIATITNAGTYTVNVTSGAGCSSSANTTVNILQDVTPPAVVAQNVIVQLNSAGQGSIVTAGFNSPVFTETFSSDVPGLRTTLANWNFAAFDMTVDVGDYIPGNGRNEIDLAGNRNATITTKKTFLFAPGQYTLTFENRLNNNPAGGNSVRVTIGNLLDQTFDSYLNTTFESVTFTVSQPTYAAMTFEQLGTNDAAGSFIGNIRLSRVIPQSYSVLVSASDPNGLNTVSVSKSTFDCSNLGNNTVQLTVTDVYNNASVQNVNVNVVDNTKPVLTPRPNITIHLDASCSITVPDLRGTATDNCSVVITQSPAAGAVIPSSHNGTVNVTVTATDPSNNTDEKIVVITARDVTAPVPALATLPTISGECSASINAPTAMDGCSRMITGVTNDPTTYSAQGTYVIHWIYDDGNGNTATQNQTVIIKDLTPPVIACPFNITVNAEPGRCGAIVNYNQPSATDNCGASATLPTSIPGYTYKGTYNGHTYFVSNTPANPETAHAAAIALGGHLATISDAAENALISGFLPGQPMWIGFTDRDVEGTFRWITNEPITYTNWASGEPNDCCGSASHQEDWAVINWAGSSQWNDWFYDQPAYYVIEFEGGTIPTTLVSGPASGSFFPVGSTTVTYSATDAGGNTVTCSFEITVRDVERPTISCPSNINAIATSAAGAVVNYTPPAGADNCSGATTTLVTGLAPGSTFPIGTTFIRYRVTDAAGLTAECSFSVTVVGVPPSIVCPENIVTSNTAGQCGANVHFAATETTAIPASTITYSHQPGSFFPVGTTIVTATATNAVGESECTFTITVNDNESPVLVGVPSAATVECDAVPQPAIVTATDNCGNVGAVRFSEVRTDGNCVSNYTLTRTWSVTDAHHNTTAATQVIMVQDTKAPVISCPDAITINCHDNSLPATTGFATATDNCSTPVISYSDVSTQSADINNRAHYNYTITRTWKAVDACNNASTCVQLIRVQDVTPPVAECRNISITLRGGQASIVATDVDGGSSDNCSPLTYAVDVSSFNCSTLGDRTVKLTVTDVSGNSSSCNATVNVVGEIPTCKITSVPTSNVYTGGNPNSLYLGYGAQSTVLKLDVPESGAPYTFVWSGNGSLSSTSEQSPTFTPSAAGVYTFTVFITNQYGCTTTCTISICVTDIRVINAKTGAWDGKKVYVCHVPPGNPANAHTLEISVNAVPAHIGAIGHGTDRLGRCEIPACSTTPSMARGAQPTETTQRVSEVKIYPNPTTGVFNLMLHNYSKGKVEVQVVDNYGKLVVQQPVVVMNTTENVSLDVTKHAAGVYHVRIVSETGVKTLRIVVAR